MTSLTKTTALLGIGSLGAAVLAAVPASAAPAVAGCGDAPTGSQLERTGDICEIDFSAAGDYDWTVPAGLTDLYAVVVGAGGGALYSNGGFAEGYAGSGGEVMYADLSTPAPGSVVDVTVGAGGTSASADPTAGSDSSVSASSLIVADGGTAGTRFAQYCAADGDFSVYVGNGSGAGGPVGASGVDCADSTAPGVEPSIDDDSSGADPLPIFSGVTTEFGAGGRIISAVGGALDSGAMYDGSGRGADVLHVAGSSDPFVQSTLPDAHDAGASGRVLLRYTAFAPAGDGETSDGDELAATGVASDSVATLGLAGGLGIVGALMLAFSRRRPETARSRR